MEVAAALRSSPQCLFKACDLSSPSCVLAAPRLDRAASDSGSQFSGRCLKGIRSISMPRRGQKGSSFGRKTAIRALASSSSPSSPIAPLQLESPIGQFLSEILIRHPHLLPAAVEQQLERLQTDREAERIKEEPSPSTSGTNVALHRRIAEVKAKERGRALEEILYALVVQKFVEADVSLVPSLSQPADPCGRVDQWLPEEGKLERLHSSEANEMIENHMALILGQDLGDADLVAPLSKLRVGQVYAASVMYGYFLRRVDKRFQLEKSVKAFPWSRKGDEDAAGQATPEVGKKPCRLRSYVMSFDSELLQRCATVRSEEAFSVIEKHIEALFDRPDIEAVPPPRADIDTSGDEHIRISLGGMRRLILEAVTFGSFLWEVESSVDTRYHFVTD